MIDLYKAESTRALFAVVAALYELPNQGSRFGPALRDLRRSLETVMLYGAVLTDIRDFLKLRFRCKGLTADDSAPTPAIGDGYRVGDLKEALDALDSESDEDVASNYFIINSVVTDLDKLSRIATVSREDLLYEVHRIREVLKSVIRWAEGPEHYERHTGPYFPGE